MVTGLGYQKKPVTAAIVREVIGDLEGRARVTRHRWLWASLGALFVAGAVLVVTPYWEFLRPGPDTAMTPPSPPPAPARPAAWSSRGLSPLPLPGDEGSAAGTIQPAVDPAAPQPAEAPLVDTRVVRKGDNLSRLAADVYGFATKEVLQRVAERNPGIADLNRILVGTAIRFPDVSDLQARRPGPTPQGQ